MRNAVQGEMKELGSSDDENWQEKEASRTHSVKFTDDGPDADKEVSTFHLSSSSDYSKSIFIYYFRHIFCMNTAESYESLYLTSRL